MCGIRCLNICLYIPCLYCLFFEIPSLSCRTGNNRILHNCSYVSNVRIDSNYGCKIYLYGSRCILDLRGEESCRENPIGTIILLFFPIRQCYFSLLQCTEDIRNRHPRILKFLNHYFSLICFDIKSVFFDFYN